MEYVTRAERLNPFERVTPGNMVGGINAGLYRQGVMAAVQAHFATGHYERVLELAAGAVRDRQDSLSWHAMQFRTTSLALLGRIDEARQSAREMLAIRPDHTVARARVMSDFTWFAV